MNLLNHYRKLWFFNFHRLKNNNYRVMREYFANILIAEVEEFTGLEGKKVLDVGGARGEFCKVINEKRGCRAFNLDPAPCEHGNYDSKFIWPDTKIGNADDLPFQDGEFDLVICRGVLEHIPREKQQVSINEMFRVVKKGGICYIAVPLWLNPFAGHGLKPFHYLPFRYAKFLAELAYKKKINAKSWAEKKLFGITFRKMRKMIKAAGFEVLAIKDTHFRLHFFCKIPLFREIMVPTTVFILSRR